MDGTTKMAKIQKRSAAHQLQPFISSTAACTVFVLLLLHICCTSLVFFYYHSPHTCVCVCVDRTFAIPQNRGALAKATEVNDNDDKRCDACLGAVIASAVPSFACRSLRSFASRSRLRFADR